MSVFSDPASRSYARFTGLTYLSIALVGPFAILYVPGQIAGADPVATLQNLTAQRGLYIAGIGGEAFIMLAEIVATALLYFMFRPVNATLSAIAALGRYTEVAVMGAMLLFSAAALSLADPGLAGFTEAQRAGLSGAMMQVHDAGVWVWQLFFTLHLVVLGVLVARSGRFPRILGYALSIGGVGYALDSLYSFAFPEADWLGMTRAGFLAIATLAELSFALWLTFRAPQAPRHAPALAA